MRCSCRWFSRSARWWAATCRPETRTAVRAAALVSAAVTLVALPLVLGYGRDPGNPSALPLPYGRGLAVLLGLIWVTALAAIVVRRIRKRFASSRGPRDG